VFSVGDTLDTNILLLWQPPSVAGFSGGMTPLFPFSEDSHLALNFQTATQNSSLNLPVRRRAVYMYVIFACTTSIALQMRNHSSMAPKHFLTYALEGIGGGTIDGA